MDEPSDTEKMLAYARRQTQIFWQSVNREFGLLTREEMSHTLGVDLAEVDRMRAAGELIAVELDQVLRFPGFQLDEDHHPRLVIRELTKLAAEYGVDDMSLAFWLHRPTTAFRDNRRAVDHLDDPSAVVDAAKWSWSVVW